MGKPFNFNISLSVLNHLGRNLYRNIITVLGEAISNSWDADASNVWIDIDKDQRRMFIIDDGIGMSEDDFQNKFLKIGYSKRKKGQYLSHRNRPYIGRKGIGKLALLSCSERVHILTKTENTEAIGGVIDNASLDKAITEDYDSQDYTLEPIKDELKTKLNGMKQGTLLYFEGISINIINTSEYLKKAIALYFKFSLYDETFNIYLNGDKITENVLNDFAQNTQFLWVINKFDDPLFKLMKNTKKRHDIETNFNIKGYIASVDKPQNLKVRGTEEKVTIDLFVNGRLREKDILRHIPTARIVENYVYGQIHFDDLDRPNSKDVFTSSREGVLLDSSEFKNFLFEVNEIFKKVIDEWDQGRREVGDDGDPDNTRISPKKRKAEELFNTTIKEYRKGKGGKKSKVDEWSKKLSEEAIFNIPSYTDCFISENLLRKYIEEKKIPLTDEAIKDAEKFKTKERNSKKKANISYSIRSDVREIYYLDMDKLANLVDKPQDKNNEAGIARSAVVYKPIRDAVGHTSIITDTAKRQLSVEYENIKARLIELLDELDNKKV